MPLADGNRDWIIFFKVVRSSGKCSLSRKTAAPLLHLDCAKFNFTIFITSSYEIDQLSPLDVLMNISLSSAPAFSFSVSLPCSKLCFSCFHNAPAVPSSLTRTNLTRAVLQRALRIDGFELWPPRVPTSAPFFSLHCSICSSLPLAFGHIHSFFVVLLTVESIPRCFNNQCPKKLINFNFWNIFRIEHRIIHEYEKVSWRWRRKLHLKRS